MKIIIDSIIMSYQIKLKIKWDLFLDKKTIKRQTNQ